MPRDATDILNRAFEYAVNDDGRALNGDIGAALRRLDPAFDTRSFGKASLLNLIDELDDVFEVERSSNGAIYIRKKDGSRPAPEPEVRCPPSREGTGQGRRHRSHRPRCPAPVAAGL